MNNFGWFPTSVSYFHRRIQFLKCYITFCFNKILYVNILKDYIIFMYLCIRLYNLLKLSVQKKTG